MKLFFNFLILVFGVNLVTPFTLFSQSGSYVIDQTELSEGKTAELKLTITLKNGNGKIIDIGNMLNGEIRVVAVERNASPIWTTTSQILFDKKVSGTALVQTIEGRAQIELNDALKSGDKLVVKLVLTVPTEHALKSHSVKKYNLDVTVRADRNSAPVLLTNSQSIKVKTDTP